MKHEACLKCSRGVGAVNIAGNILMIGVKGYMGVAGGSKGLLADAIHSCADLLATIVMIIGLRISSREKSELYPYGYGKTEYIISIIIYLFLVVIAGYILYDGVVSIMSGKVIVPCMVAAWGAVFSILINEMLFRYSLCVGTQIDSPSIRAKAWESRSDVYSSIAVVVGIIGAKMGFHFMDPLAAVVVGLMILKISFEMIAEAVPSLMDATPAEMDLSGLKKRFMSAMADIIVSVEEFKAREMGGSLEFTVVAFVPDCITVELGEEIKRDIEKTVNNLEEKKSTVIVRLKPYAGGKSSDEK